MIPRLALLLLFLSFSAHAQLSVDLGPIQAPTDGSDVGMAIATITNETEIALENRLVDATVSGARLIVAEEDGIWRCRFNNNSPAQLQCHVPRLEPRQSVPLKLFIKPALEGRITVTVSTVGGIDQSSVVFYRRVPVTNANDHGEGSLREAIRYLNEVCDAPELPIPCAIDIAVPHIAPLTPLPAITARDFLIESTAVLDGSALFAGHGLEVRGINGRSRGIIRNLEIRGFPWNGLHVMGAHVLVERTRVTANGGRGVTVERATVDLNENVIDGNARSGVFVAPESSVVLTANTIEANGASGVFFGERVWVAQARRNRIAGNAHFGVGIAWPAASVILDANSIAGNALGGVDRGLDGFSGHAFDDSVVYNAKIPPPRIVSATYDAASGATLIRGTYFGGRDRWGQWSVQLFANDVAEAQGDLFLGTTEAPPTALDEGVVQPFSLTVAGDLRGKFITALGQRTLNLGWSGVYYWPSEFTEPVEVQ